MSNAMSNAMLKPASLFALAPALNLPVSVPSMVFTLVILCSSAWSSLVYGEVTITEIQPLKFPSALMIFGRNTVVEVDWKGEITNTTNTILLDDDYYQGRYLITSNSSLPININIISLDNEPFVELNRIRVRYKNKTYNSLPILGVGNPGSVGAVVEIGAKVVSNKNASQGLKHPQYLLTIQEQ